MMNEKLNHDIRKNLLDLEYTKTVQYFNTSLLILFTYFIGIAIAIITGQINYVNLGKLWMIIAFSMLVITFCLVWAMVSRDRLKEITDEIKNLEF